MDCDKKIKNKKIGFKKRDDTEIKWKKITEITKKKGKNTLEFMLVWS